MSYDSGSNYRYPKEPMKEELYKFLSSTNKPHFVDTFRKLLNAFDKEEISMSKFVEELNIQAFDWFKSNLEGLKEDGPSGRSLDVDSVASHSSTLGNSIELCDFHGPFFYTENGIAYCSECKKPLLLQH